MEQKFEMVAKTLKGLEEVLAEELRDLGAENVEPGRRMVSFEGDLATLYKANLCCRTALRILKPFYKFTADNPDELYERVKEYDWSTLLSLDKTFCIDTVVNSDDFTHSHFVTYRVKDGIVDWFRDRYGADKRPGVRLKDADIMINVHISENDITLSLDSSGESLHKRGYRVAQTEAPINEVLAAGIILMSGWRGDTTFVDPMCGSGTFLIEAALIAANINPGIYRKSFAFESWPDFDADLFDSLYNDDSGERDVTCKIIGADISPKAIEIARENIKSAGVGKYVSVEVKPISQWDEAPLPEGVIVTNPPYGERISAPDMEALYSTIGTKLKNVFVGYHAWIIGYHEEYFHCIGLAPSQKVSLLNGSLECQLREYIIFEGDKKSYLAAGGSLRIIDDDDDDDDAGYRSRKGHDYDRGRDRKPRRRFDDDDRSSRRRFNDDKPRRRFDDDKPRRRFDDDKPRRRFDDDKPRRFDDDKPRRFDDDKPRRFDDDKPRRRFDDDKPRRFDDDKPRRRFDDDKPRRRFDDDEPREAPENPLAVKRNPRLIKAIMERSEKKNSEGNEGANNRPARGWRKK